MTEEVSFGCLCRDKPLPASGAAAVVGHERTRGCIATCRSLQVGRPPSPIRGKLGAIALIHEACWCLTEPVGMVLQVHKVLLVGQGKADDGVGWPSCQEKRPSKRAPVTMSLRVW